MLIKLRCKSCFAKVSADDELIGKEVNCPNCSHLFSLPKPQFGFGKILGGYEIEQWLGSGAMGEVYLARQVSMNRPVALKVIKHDISMDKEVVDRFAHEAQILASLNHPSIVPAFDAGHTSECYYMAMGYVDGETLEDRLKRHGRMDETEVLDIALKIAEALKYAWNEFKLLHRDIKPANIMIDNMNEIKIMDMGIAKNTTDEGGLTKVGLVVGTPFYMSPEQAQASTGIDFRSDVYALAATMYHILTGSLPFQGPNVMAILAKKVNFPLVPANEINPDLSQETSDFISRLLKFKVSDRLESFDELFDMLHTGKKAAAAMRDKKRKNDERTVHMRVPDKVLEHIAKTKSEHKLKKQKKAANPKVKYLIISLIALCLVLSLSLALIDNSNKEVATPDGKELKKPLNAVVESSTESKPTEVKATENIDTTSKLNESNINQFLSKNSLIRWNAGRSENQKEKLVYKGSSSIGYIGEMNLRQGMFSFNEKELSKTLDIKENNEFSILFNFKSKDFKQKEVCIMSFGTDEKSADLIITQKEEEISLIIRNAQKRELISLGNMGRLRTNLILSYGESGLSAYINGRQTLDRQGYKIDTEKWTGKDITFGSFKEGKHRFWRGDVYAFTLLKKSLSKDDVDSILKMIVDGIRKLDRQSGDF
ncbi:MAG: protein kinase [Lentisphaeraceae bacterium]|nr:protein kinase [Lentisphaeraceae bacterium]